MKWEPNLKKIHTEKLYTKSRFYLASIFITLFINNIAFATKMARTTVVDLVNTAEMVAVVKIVSSKLTSQSQRQVHTSTPLPLIEHKAQVLKSIKTNSNDSLITFLNINGLRVGKKYIIFLIKNKKNNFKVMLNGYGAIAISYVTLKNKFVEATRIADSFIELPKLIKHHAGITTKNEVATYIWSDLSEVVKYLENTATPLDSGIRRSDDERD